MIIIKKDNFSDRILVGIVSFQLAKIRNKTKHSSIFRGLYSKKIHEKDKIASKWVLFCNYEVILFLHTTQTVLFL